MRKNKKEKVTIQKNGKTEKRKGKSNEGETHTRLDILYETSK